MVKNIFCLDIFIAVNRKGISGPWSPLPRWSGYRYNLGRAATAVCCMAAVGGDTDTSTSSMATNKKVELDLGLGSVTWWVLVLE